MQYDNQIPTGDRFHGYKDEEEYLAIIATNVYMSANGVDNDGLRGGHDGHYALQPPLNTSAGFLADPTNRKLMKIYQLAWADAFRGLAGVKVPFNPFRERSGQQEIDLLRHLFPQNGHARRNRAVEPWLCVVET